MVECPVCKSPQALPYDTNADSFRFDCPRCGEFDLVGSLMPGLQSKLDAGIQRRALMSHNIRRMQHANKKPPVIATNDVESYWLGERLPTPLRQADDLILWVGDNQLSPDQPIRCALSFLSAWVGTSLIPTDANNGGIHWLCTYLADEKLVEARPYPPGPGPFSAYDMRLRMQGWRKYFELKQSGATSRIAFMAMKFDQTDLNHVIEKCFRPAVARAGFELRLLTDKQPAGIIDDQMRAAIMASRFVISDLTHGSPGAYWEAGFGEGLGRPVIYTCDKTAWDTTKTHFDTNHLVTIVWDRAELKAAEDKLAATIRATMRAEAKQFDD